MAFSKNRYLLNLRLKVESTQQSIFDLISIFAKKKERLSNTTNTMNYNITREELLSVPSWRDYNPKADIFGGEYYCTSVIIIPTLEPSEDYDWNKIHYVICINHKPAFKVEGYSDSLRIKGDAMIDCLKCGLFQVHDSGNNMIIRDVTCSTVTIETLK